ncbi:hypothetical protein RhiJN_01947 [Ceratobasidium sp. AG-Ba]|nr:hypothetical protein RhiJN_01947 [Ceratobasidium sp. AG-Ba]QRW02880.1 hypothetical protein RhiLY_01879 [Ceratobasidium sp. AG-Ba]
MPQSLANSLYTLAPNTVPLRAVLGPRGTSTPYAFPCSYLLAISLQLNGMNCTISPQDLVPKHRNSAQSGACISNLHTWLNPNESSLVLGSLFTHTTHVNSHDCFAATEFDKRHSRLYDDSDSRWKKAVIGGTIGGVVGAAFLAVGAFLLFRLCRGGGVRQRGDIPSRSIESIQPPEHQSRQPIDKSIGPRPSNPPSIHASSSRSPDMSIPLQPVASPNVRSTYSTAGSLPQPPAPLRLQRIDRGSEVRTSSGSQFTEHFGDIPSEYVRTRSPLGDKPLPHIPFHPPPPASPGRPELSAHPEPSLTFVPFDAHSQRAGAGTASSSSHHRKGSTSPNNSLPPGAASPVESVGSYKPAQQSHSRDVSI